MQCQQALELLSGHIDNTNTEEQEAMLQEHLSTCEHCRELLKAYEELDQGICELEVEPPAALAENVMKAVRQEVQTPGKRKFFFGPGTALAAVAAVLVLALGSGVVKLPQLMTNANGAQSADQNSAETASYAFDAKDTAAPEAQNNAAPEKGVDDAELLPREMPMAQAPDSNTASAPSQQEQVTATGPDQYDSAGKQDGESMEGTAMADCVVYTVYDGAEKQELEAAFDLSFEPLNEEPEQQSYRAEASVVTIEAIVKTVDESIPQELQFPEGITSFAECAQEDLGYVVIVFS